jgi:hypothetical protein
MARRSVPEEDYDTTSDESETIFQVFNFNFNNRSSYLYLMNQHTNSSSDEVIRVTIRFLQQLFGEGTYIHEDYDDNDTTLSERFYLKWNYDPDEQEWYMKDDYDEETDTDGSLFEKYRSILQEWLDPTDNVWLLYIDDYMMDSELKEKVKQISTYERF